jgi:formylglycine-generating enzyme required for sulfatase activity
LRHGEIDAALNALRVTGDPESLTQFVHGARARGVSPSELVACLDRVDTTRQTVSGEARKLEDRVRFGLLLALGDFMLDDIAQSQREDILPRVAEWHAHDASSAIHGATGWLLRHWGQGDVARQVDETPTAYSPDREWFTLKIEPQPRQHEAPARQESESSGDVLGKPSSDADAPAAQIENPESKMQNSFCITFIVFSPGKYLLGSPDGEADRQTDERRHQVEITRSYAISDREITWAQFNPFDGADKHDWMETLYDRELALAEPAFGVDWFQAVSYCRWLTSQMGVAESEQSYADPSSLEKDGEGNPKNWPLDIAKHGFRLPTEAEWEIACRGGTLSAWSFGSDVDLLRHYAWFADSAWFMDSPGQLRPNPRGLFDLHGNLGEWCHDWYDFSYSDDAIDPLGVLTGAERVGRGGEWYAAAAYCRTAYRDGYRPTYNTNGQGFRLALSSVQSAEEAK